MTKPFQSADDFNVASTDILNDADIVSIVAKLNDPRATRVAQVVARRLAWRTRIALALFRMVLRGVL